jgi:O-acetyl-ADP-ribose deacetylase (regulator of RNase III)
MTMGISGIEEIGINKKIGDREIGLVKADITDFDIECFVYYAGSNLKLGSGFGGAIAVRGGPGIQKALELLAPLGPCEAVITEAGELRADYIIHANGPKFQEEDTDNKLRKTVINILKLADQKRIKRIAFPPLGTGFYGIPLEKSADISLTTVKEYLQGETGIEQVVFCATDGNEYTPFKARLDKLA